MEKKVKRRELLIGLAAAVGGAAVVYLSKEKPTLEQLAKTTPARPVNKQEKPVKKHTYTKQDQPKPISQREIISPVKTYNVPCSDSISGLTFDGSSFWMTAQSVSQPDLFLQYSLDGEFQQTIISSRDGNPAGGLAFDGENLVNLNYNTNGNTGRGTIDRFSLEGEFLGAQPAIGKYNTFGIAHNGSEFFQAHSPSMRSNSTIYTLNGDLKRIRKNSVPFYIRGLAWDGKNLWASSKNNMIYKLGKDFTIEQAVKTSVQVQDITWANGKLYGTQTNSKMLHEFDISE